LPHDQKTISLASGAITGVDPAGRDCAPSSSASGPRDEGDAPGSSLTLRWHTRSASSRSGTVVATGVFDLLHVGHVRFLRAARAAGARLAVGIEDDERTRARKGSGRPIIAAEERCEMLAALECVDGVFVISGPLTVIPACAYTRLLAALRPSTIAFTEGDPAADGKRLVAARLGASVFEVARVERRSTTFLVERMLGQPARSLRERGPTREPRR
jgi:cytidyltransferase-like protein